MPRISAPSEPERRVTSSCGAGLARAIASSWIDRAQDIRRRARAGTGTAARAPRRSRAGARAGTAPRRGSTRAGRRGRSTACRHAKCASERPRDPARSAGSSSASRAALAPVVARWIRSGSLPALCNGAKPSPRWRTAPARDHREVSLVDRACRRPRARLRTRANVRRASGPPTSAERAQPPDHRERAGGARRAGVVELEEPHAHAVHEQEAEHRRAAVRGDAHHGAALLAQLAAQELRERLVGLAARAERPRDRVHGAAAGRDDRGQRRRVAAPQQTRERVRKGSVAAHEHERVDPAIEQRRERGLDLVELRADRGALARREPREARDETRDRAARCARSR